jgi:hypothetical protein
MGRPSWAGPIGSQRFLKVEKGGRRRSEGNVTMGEENVIKESVCVTDFEDGERGPKAQECRQTAP